MRRLIVAAFVAVFSFSAFALPSVDDVQAEMVKGNYAHAEEMMGEVVAARPGSARAHYVYAEILAHDKRFGLAAEEAAVARKIDPAIKFTQPDKFTAFEQLLAREQTAAKRATSSPARMDSVAAPALRETAQPASGGGMPGWIWGLLVAAIALIAWRMFARARQGGSSVLSGVPGAGVPAAAGAAPGYGTPYGSPAMPPAPGAPGHGMLGTGLAVAGGVAAGMLAEKMFEGHRESGLSSLANPAGGYTPGMFDGAPGAEAAARELEERKVDLGSGDGWGGGDDSGSSDDGGGSSGDDGGW
jgi:uncharacterized membrane protein YgcG